MYNDGPSTGPNPAITQTQFNTPVPAGDRQGGNANPAGFARNQGPRPPARDQGGANTLQTSMDKSVKGRIFRGLRIIRHDPMSFFKSQKSTTPDRQPLGGANQRIHHPKEMEFDAIFDMPSTTQVVAQLEEIFAGDEDDHNVSDAKLISKTAIELLKREPETLETLRELKKAGVNFDINNFAFTIPEGEKYPPKYIMATNTIRFDASKAGDDRQAESFVNDLKGRAEQHHSDPALARVFLDSAVENRLEETEVVEEIYTSFVKNDIEGRWAQKGGDDLDPILGSRNANIPRGTNQSSDHPNEREFDPILDL